MARRRSRILAFQALYSWNLNHDNLDTILEFEWTEKKDKKTGEILELTSKEKEERIFASLIVSGTVNHIDEIDQVIKEHLSKNWTIERINKVTLAILRAGIYELMFQKDIQPQIVIDEAVTISKEYDSDDSYKFVNALLDKVRKDLASNS